MGRASARMWVLMWVVGLVATHAAAAGVVINEVMASNTATLADERGEFDDWLELHNPGSLAVNVGGLYLTDDYLDLTRWQIPERSPDSTTVPTGGHLLFWLDSQPKQGVRHGGPKLSQSGDVLLLVDRDGVTVIDSVRFGAQTPDVAYGRYPDGQSQWSALVVPTPGQSNGPTAADVPLPAPVLLPGPGLAATGVEVQLSSVVAGAEIYYTLDGSDPVPGIAPRYAAPVRLPSTTVLRARSFLTGRPASTIVTGTYLIDESSSLPMVSLTTPPGNLFDTVSGLFEPGPDVPAGESWPYPSANWFTQGPKTAHLEYFTRAGAAGFAAEIELSVSGGWDRAYPKKSLQVRATGATPRIDYPLFADNDYQGYRELVLDASVGDLSYTRNEMLYGAVRELDMRVDLPAHHAVRLYINGAYWGLYRLSEAVDSTFVAHRHNETDAYLNTGWSEITQGSWRSFADLLSVFGTNDVTGVAGYSVVRQQLALKSLIDFWVLQVYTNNGDLGGSSYWRPRSAAGQWRWIGGGFDWWPDVETSSLGELATDTEPDNFLLLGYLLQNASFRAQFLARLADFLNTVGRAERAAALVDSAAAEVAPEIDRDLARWHDWVSSDGPGTLSRGDYDWALDYTRAFVRRRPEALRQQVATLYQLPGSARFTVDCSPGGRVQVSTVRPDSLPWSGTYFQQVPFPVEALADSGYSFAAWDPPSLGGPEAEVMLTNDFAVVANFEAVGQVALSLNEIQAVNDTTWADENGEFDDWLELYNPGDHWVDAGGLYLSDDPTDLTRWQIPDTDPAVTTLAPGGHLVFWMDGQANQGARHASFRLSQNGEIVMLVDRDGLTVLDSLRLGGQTAGVSLARFPDGRGDWAPTGVPTPGRANGEQAAGLPVPPPVLTPDPGFYPGPVVLTIAVPDAGAAVYYTVDGNDPQPVEAQRYRGPFTVSATAVIRARAWAAGRPTSPAVIGTYFVNTSERLAVVSLSTPPATLFDPVSGMFVPGPGVPADELWPYQSANWFKRGARPAHIEFFEPDGRRGFAVDVGIEASGFVSRAFPKKSIDVKMGKEFGPTEIDYPLFADNPYHTYDGMLLRAGSTDLTRTRNELIYKANRRFAMHVAMQAYRPVSLYINGRYWGVYCLMERKGTDFIASRYGEQDIDLVSDWGILMEGTLDSFLQTMEFLRTHDISVDSVYAQVRQTMSIKSLMDYWVLFVYTNNTDPINSRYWRPRRADAQWSWIANDFDVWQEPERSVLAEFAANKAPTDFVLLGYMLQNRLFRDEFCNRLADFLNTTGSAEVMTALLDESVAETASDLDRDLARWRSWIDYGRRAWIDYEVGAVTLTRERVDHDMAFNRAYMTDRPALLRQQVVDLYQLPGLAQVTVDVIGPGRVKVNTVSPDTLPWSGVYFRGIPIKVHAEAAAGYRFAGWAEADVSGADLSLDLTDDRTLTARFERAEGPVVINEVCYHAGPELDSGDWVELLNRSGQPVDLSGWSLAGSNGAVSPSLPDGVVLGSGAMLVLERDLALFSGAYPQSTAMVYELGFALGNAGERLSLVDGAGGLVDEVRYSDAEPWPVTADGAGPTLELRDPAADNAVAASWQASPNRGGSPGRANGSGTGTAVAEIGAGAPPTAWALRPNYPNPFNSTTLICYEVPVAAPVELAVFDLAGQRVATLMAGPQLPGVYAVPWAGRDDGGRALASGVYLCRLAAGSFVQTRRVLLLK